MNRDSRDTTCEKCGGIHRLDVSERPRRVLDDLGMAEVRV